MSRMLRSFTSPIQQGEKPATPIQDFDGDSREDKGRDVSYFPWTGKEEGGHPTLGEEAREVKASSSPGEETSIAMQGGVGWSRADSPTTHYSGSRSELTDSLLTDVSNSNTTGSNHSYNITQIMRTWTSSNSDHASHYNSTSAIESNHTAQSSHGTVAMAQHHAAGSSLSSLADGITVEAFTSHSQGVPTDPLGASSTPLEADAILPRPCNGSDLFYLDLHNLSWELNCSLNYSSLEDDDITLVYRRPLLGGVLTFFAVVTILGNLLVIAAVVRERYLRTVTNYFIVSLAIADLIIGGVVMPFSIFLEVTNDVWIFGSDWCDVWHSFDVLASTASILNLSVISLDRYWAITDPIAYPSKMSTGRSFVLMALIWICSAAISFPAILWWRSVVTEPMPPHVCAFTEDTGYLIFSSLVSFYFPVSIILFAYYKIYKAATEQTRSLRTGCKVMSTDGLNGEVMTLRIHRGGGVRDQDDAIHYSRAANSDSDGESPSHVSMHHHIGPHGDVRPSRMISRKWKHFAISKKLSKLAKEQKAAKTLGIVMGVFCMCWVPFFVANVLYGLCNLECVAHADILLPVFSWLGYINSGMNPVIYACSMRDFRRAFLKILCCFCPGYIRFRSRKRYMETNYSLSTSSFGMGCGVERCSNVRL